MLVDVKRIRKQNVLRFNSMGGKMNLKRLTIFLPIVLEKHQNLIEFSLFTHNLIEFNPEISKTIENDTTKNTFPN